MIRVLSAEDMHMIRGALVALLDIESDIEVVADLDRGDAVVAIALKARQSRHRVDGTAIHA